MIQRMCSHADYVIVKHTKMSNGSPWVYEACPKCEDRMGSNMPIVSDKDVLIASYKYPGKTLGEIYEVDKEYVRWIVCKSKASDRIKKSAARIYFDKPYVVPGDGCTYSRFELYNAVDSANLVRLMLLQDNICPWCKEKVLVSSFRDDLSKKEFEISGLCQTCQDNTFKK